MFGPSSTMVANRVNKFQVASKIASTELKKMMLNFKVGINPPLLGEDLSVAGVNSDTIFICLSTPGSNFLFTCPDLSTAELFACINAVARWILFLP